MRVMRAIAGRRLRLMACVVASSVGLAFAGGAVASTPKAGSYRVSTSQCGSSALAHPCYGFTFKIAKGHCVAPQGSKRQAGFCVTFSHTAKGGVAFADVTCPDAKSFQTTFIGPEIPYRLSPTGAFDFTQHSGISEGGREYVVGRETLTLSVKGSRVTGTLTALAQENIGLEAPTCATGKVTLTVKKL